MVVVYWRFAAGLSDMRMFKDGNEFMDWMKFATKWEPIAIIGIYDKETTWGETEEAIRKFKEYLK